MRGSEQSIKQGFIKLLPVLDNQGRAIMYANPALAAPDDEEDAPVIKVWWYLIHVAMSNPNVRKHGFVAVINLNDVRLKHFKPKRLVGEWFFCASLLLMMCSCHDYSLYNIVLLYDLSYCQIW